jgi:AraC-like DNA-binding protein
MASKIKTQIRENSFQFSIEIQNFASQRNVYPTTLQHVHFFQML